MNATTITPWLRAIGDEGRRIAQGHGHCYDLVIRFKSGETKCSNLLRFIPRRDEHMRRTCDWLRRSGRARDIESISLVPQGKQWAYVYDPQAPGTCGVILDWEVPC